MILLVRERDGLNMIRVLARHVSSHITGRNFHATANIDELCMEKNIKMNTPYSACFL
jgi:hypothetical protein